MSSLQKMLTVLDIFSQARTVVTADEIITHFGYARGTAYRYIRVLCGAGLLSRISGTYVLGPRIVELDYYIRQTDPILRVSQPVIRRLRDEFDCDVLLTSYYEDRIIVSHHERGKEQITMSYGRGRVMPLFEGAGSTVIIAFLPEAKQKRLFETHKAEIIGKGIADSWTSFHGHLSKIKRARYSISIGDLDVGNVGVAAPILFDYRQSNLGSIVMVFSQKRYALLDRILVTEIVIEAAAYIDRLLEDDHSAESSDIDWLEVVKAS